MGSRDLRYILNEFDDGFLAVSETENLIELNAQWLRQLPDLVVLSDDKIAEELRRRVEAIPDREDRIAAARAAEPQYMKVIRALCAAAGHELDRVTAGDPTLEYKRLADDFMAFSDRQGAFSYDRPWWQSVDVQRSY
jgi:hypothetical protein